MKELISKKAAIETVFSMCCRWDTEDPNDLKHLLLSAFLDLPPVRQWIPTKERKPDLNEKVIFQFEFHGEPDFLLASRKDIPGIADDSKAWMSLPEPYKGTKNG